MNCTLSISAIALSVVVGIGVSTHAAMATVPLDMSNAADLRDVADPRRSPDGAWVAYLVTQDDTQADRRRTTVWLAKLSGTDSRAIATVHDDASTLHWSPDGKSLGFLSARGIPTGLAQIWTVDPANGAVTQRSSVDGEVTQFEWAPDGRHVALVVRGATEFALLAAPDGLPMPKPIIVNRFYFKEDVSGYLGRERQQIDILDVSTGHVVALTSGRYDNVKPSWSPDGHRLAFVSKRGDDPDRHSTFGIYVMAAEPGSAEQLVTTYQGTTYQGDAASDWAGAPSWSLDGHWLAYVTAGDPRLIYYSVHQLAVVPASGGPPRMVAPTLDRNVSLPRWSHDGLSLYALVEDDGSSRLTRFDVQKGATSVVLAGRRSTTAFDLGSHDEVVVLDSTPMEPSEVYVVADGRRHAVSHQNAWLARIDLGDVDEITWSSTDGTIIHGLLTKPPGYQPGRPYTTIFHLHGGPTSQFENAFDFEQQLLAAQGYLVVAPNPRGSAGRGEEYAAAIYADWGNKDVADVLAAADMLVARGLADPGRLGIGGWSYGGMLTNYVITRDWRFRAAISGAAVGNMLAAYGTDMYVREYEAEIGTPWQNPALWVKLSFPFMEADRIRTPTLFLCGSLDFSVPALHSEQLYQALRSLGRDTELVVYPGQSHSFVRPSFIRDRLIRSMDWYRQHLAPPELSGGSSP
jgi:dipeptidyl aminopeptidase/acylaminoacyl peptidase